MGLRDGWGVEVGVLWLLTTCVSAGALAVLSLSVSNCKEGCNSHLMGLL